MRPVMLIALAILASLSLGSFAFLSQDKFGQKPEGARQQRIAASPYFADGKFQNLEPTPVNTEGEGGMKGLYGFFFKKKERNVPVDTLPSVRTDLSALPLDQDALVWFGHSSFMLVFQGKRILVDPVFSDYASPVSGIIKAFPIKNRYTAEQMPPIDLLIITHDHWDHLDHATVTALRDRVAHVVCGLGVGATLELWGFAPEKIHEMQWGDTLSLYSGFTLHAHTARHFSGRSLDGNKTLWSAYSLIAKDQRLFISGDGGYGKHFGNIGSQFGPYDWAILENGQYNKAWKNIHIMPSELVTAAKDLRAQRVLTVHHSKFPLSLHPWDEPLELAYKNFAEAGIPLSTPQIGEPLLLGDSTQSFKAWWRN